VLPERLESDLRGLQVDPSDRRLVLDGEDGLDGLVAGGDDAVPQRSRNASARSALLE
jgi:hypothetical protein